MDSSYREIQRQLRQDPTNPELIHKMVQAKVRSGEPVTEYYKVVNSRGRFLSPTQFTFNKSGKVFKSKESVVKELHKLHKAASDNIKMFKSYTSRPGNDYYKSELTRYEAFLKDLNSAKLITYQSFTVETEAEELDLETEMQKLELEKLRKQKEQIENREKELLAKAARLEKLIQKKEKKD